MKTIIKSIAICTLFISLTAFTSTPKEKKVVKESTITWIGKKIFGSHTGSVTLKHGFIEMEGNQLVGGEFVVDMTSISDSDLDGGSKQKLERHLKSDDFFGVDEHPTATLIITGAIKNGNTYETTGELTIKGITEPVTFNLEMGATGARASVQIDRTLYGIKYGSGSFTDNLADNTISDNFELDVVLKF